MEVMFGKAVNGALVRAMPYVKIGGIRWTCPTAEMYAKADDGPWLPIEDKKPTCDQKHYAVAADWKELDGKVVRQYVIRDIDPPKPHVRKWTPLSIKRALMMAEKWDEVKGIVEAAGLYDDFIMAQVIAEDDDAFKTGYAHAVEIYGKEAVDAILAQIPEEP